MTGVCSSVGMGGGESGIDVYRGRASGKGRARTSGSERGTQAKIGRPVTAPSAKPRGVAKGTRELTRGMCSVVCQCITIMLLLVPAGFAWTLAELNEGQAQCHERVSAFSCDEEQGQVKMHI